MDCISIRVHVLNFHSIFPHIEIVLENTSTKTYYGINRWELPENGWSQKPQSYITSASSVYTFDIDADPNTIVQNWRKYWSETEEEASILGNNCAVAAQWFLTEFAAIPSPNLSNVSFNHLAFGIVWPSIIPCPVTLPGRIMSNVKFHVEARHHPEMADQYSKLFLYASIALAVLALSASIFALSVAATVLTGGIATLAITCSIIGIVASSYGFFQATNFLSAKGIGDELKKADERSMGSDSFDRVLIR